MGHTKDPAVAHFDRQLRKEAATWCILDEEARHEKIQRERIRHYGLIRDLLLDKLDTSRMSVLEIGGGPIPLSDLLQWQSRFVVDPCTDFYADYFPVPDHICLKAEEMDDDFEERFDLVICTNALDHVASTMELAVVDRIRKVLRPGGYLALMCAENNALTNPHPCHKLNLTSQWAHRWLDREFETVWELNFPEHGYRYGWAEFQGKVGQPAFAILGRKVVGYA